MDVAGVVHWARSAHASSWRGQEAAVGPEIYIPPVISIPPVIEDLAALKAEIAALKAEIESLKKQLAEKK